MPKDATLQVVRLTPPGRGAVATVRVEGLEAVAAFERLFLARDRRPLASHDADRPVVGRFGDGPGDEVVARRTPDGAVELHCHGGTAAVAMIEEALLRAGCRRVEWRAWTAAQCVDPNAAAAAIALADAPTERVAAILLDQYHGALGRERAEIEEARNRGHHERARRRSAALDARAELGRHLVHPWRVVLAGGVNVGKSSLLNALAGYGRAIVHPTPGTTRDAVAVRTAIDGWPVELCDTAGLRASDNPVEQAGIALARQRMAQADLVVLVADQSRAWSAANQALADECPRALLAHNKCDLSPAEGGRPAGLPVSALRGDGIEHLLESIARRLVPDPPPPGAGILL